MSDNTAVIHLRVPSELKAKWVLQSRAEGKRLTDWIVEKIEKNEDLPNTRDA